jgi:hypothetical protein
MIKFMNYVYLSPHFPTNYYPFVIKLREAGANVLGIGDCPYDQLSYSLKRYLTEYYRVSEMHHYDELIRAVGYFTHRYGKIDRFESHNEYWLEAESQIRTDFNISGPKTTDMYNYANDFDIYAEYANMIVHNRFDAQVTHPYHCAYLGRKNHIRYALPHHEVLSEFSGLLVHHQPMEAVLRNALGDYGYILRSPHLNDVLAAEQVILAAQRDASG